MTTNPLREGLGEGRMAEPSVLVVFGASGDLSRRKLFPALYTLAAEGLLPAGQSIIGVSRTPWSDDEFRAAMREACDEHARRRPVDPSIWETFAEALWYVPGELNDDALYQRLKAKAEEIDRSRNTGGRRINYLAIPPELFDDVAAGLGSNGMVNAPEAGGPFTRVVIEKPFGHDLDSARALNAQAVSIFGERQIFRIDHYLGKETVQNLLLLRFANGVFEPFWNRQYVDHVQITVAESIGIEGRGAYFDRAGIVRDVVQNHMLQLLALVAMEPPAVYGAHEVRDEKVKVFSALRPFPEDAEERARLAVFGQYGKGAILGEPVEGYHSEKAVTPGSRTETFAAIEAWVDNWRWAGVPFFLRAGKRMPKRATTISIHFRPAPHPLFRNHPGVTGSPNVLAIRIQPDEGISLRFESKVPGPELQSHPVTMEFRYATSFGAEPPEAYERLLLDTMIGDATLFARRDEVEAAWRWLDPLLEGYERGTAAPEPYEAGTWGPEGAARLIGDRRWRAL